MRHDVIVDESRIRSMTIERINEMISDGFSIDHMHNCSGCNNGKGK